MVLGCLWEQINLSWQRNQLPHSSLWSSPLSTSKFNFIFIILHYLWMSTGSRKPCQSVVNTLLPQPNASWATKNRLSSAQCCRLWRFTAWNKISIQFSMGRQGLPGLPHPAPTSLTGSLNPNLIRSFEIPTCKLYPFCDYYLAKFFPFHRTSLFIWFVVRLPWRIDWGLHLNKHQFNNLLK